MFKAKVSIIYLCWADEPQKYLAEALDSIQTQTYPKDLLQLVIVYNGPREGEISSVDYIRSEIFQRQNNLPETVVLEPGSNVGFPAGNNFGARYAVKNGADYVFLHNADGYLAAEAITELVKAMETNKNVGECQPLMLLHPEKELINSAGNNLHYLGIGYCYKYRETYKPNMAEIYDTGYVSGACAFMRADLLRQHGYWNERFFLYHEDTEYTLRLVSLGYRAVSVNRAIFYHKYNFSNKPDKMFWIERNRHVLQLMFYRWPTLILILPMEIIFNLGLLILSAAQGWIKELLAVYVYWMTPANWRQWLIDRHAIQRDRTVGDSRLLSRMTSRISFAGLKIPKIILLLANLVFTLYFFLLKIVIWW
ncbi:MAG: hypothetical protein COU29_03420 [Candidatus Magasanikbacteria bacterium CG10_big_fil_rev_8_21_14_0_10_36_32]|uniref:Glycosyltransferase 2-like domain-containing protein n=1 Tax=Candidatus Magasanikbacteria bacterium CG10_big_fil_rev_8_21_14_0_10_36_32 TaxID=1974646 RepID=A0A2M6W6B0_9BACT|nr:MAG: hypothetical protein COU29_03420 [Candidatus Magasanikbacteria bacterium CG10_big_fil_rev_8_21_14_0_10_36_32]